MSGDSRCSFGIPNRWISVYFLAFTGLLGFVLVYQFKNETGSAFNNNIYFIARNYSINFRWKTDLNVEQTETTPTISLLNHADKDKNRKLAVYVRGHGRLGNNLFQYATAYTMALLTNRTAFWIDGIGSIDMYKVFPHLSVQKVKRFHPSMSPNDPASDNHLNLTITLDLIRQSEEDYRLCCYPNSLLDDGILTVDLENKLRSQFTFEKKLLEMSDEFLSNCTLENTNVDDVMFVGVHVRRGDMIEHIKKYPHMVIPQRDYFIEAMQFYEDEYPSKKLIFVVASQDQKWVVENIANATNTSRIVFSSFSRGEQDLALLSLCNHTIITVGTFGRWAGWLAGGHIIEPMRCSTNSSDVCLKHIEGWRK